MRTTRFLALSALLALGTLASLPGESKAANFFFGSGYGGTTVGFGNRNFGFYGSTGYPVYGYSGYGYGYGYRPYVTTPYYGYGYARDYGSSFYIGGGRRSGWYGPGFAGRGWGGGRGWRR